MPRWTPEARQRQAELVRTWQPWLSSTGPATRKGKAIASQNARKHGRRSADMIRLTKILRRFLRDENRAPATE